MDPTLHSFGGSALDRHLFDFMPDDGAAVGAPTAGGDAGGTAAPSPDAVSSAAAGDAATAQGEPTPPDGATATAEPPAPTTPAVPLEVQAELEYLRNQVGQFATIAQQLQGGQITTQQAGHAAQLAGADLSGWNALDDDAGDRLMAFLQQRDQQMLGRFEQLAQQIQQPLLAQQEAQVVAEGEQRLSDMLADDIARNGEFATDPTADAQARQLVRTLAEQAFPEIAARYGATPRAAEMAMAEASSQVRNLLRAAGSAAVTQHVNHTATLAGVHGEPGAAGVAGVGVTPIARVNGPSLASKYAR